MRGSIISDTPWGYGSPQIRYLRDSIEAEFGISVNVYAPIYENRETINEEGVLNLVTEHSIHSRLGLEERLRAFISIINRERPEILILVNPENLITLQKLKYRPRLVIYYALEEIGSTFVRPVFFGKRLEKNIDLIISPEINRLASDAQELKIDEGKQFLVLNCPPLIVKQEKPNNPENIFLYAGTLTPTNVDLDTLNALSELGTTSIYGDFQELKGFSLTGIMKGLVRPENLREAYRDSAYSLVLWKSTKFGVLNAAPNKLFQSISFGTPFVSFPYPQAVKVVRKYGCGIIANDFSKKAFLEAAERSLDILRSGKLEVMNTACLNAYKRELNWNSQIAPVISFIAEKIGKHL